MLFRCPMFLVWVLCGGVLVFRYPVLFLYVCVVGVVLLFRCHGMVVLLLLCVLCCHLRVSCCCCCW